MEITNRFLPTENPPNGDAEKLVIWDKVQDPEDDVDPLTSRSDIDIVADFMRLLAPPPTFPWPPSAQSGSLIFQHIGCAICHTPILQYSKLVETPFPHSTSNPWPLIQISSFTI